MLSIIFFVSNSIANAKIICTAIYFIYDNKSVLEVFSASSAVVHSNKCFFDIFILYIVFIIAFNDIYALNGNTKIDIIPLKMLEDIIPILLSNFFCFLVPSFLNIIAFNKSKIVGINILKNITVYNNKFLVVKLIIVNASITLISKRLLLKLSNILNFDKVFNGFFIFSP